MSVIHQELRIGQRDFDRTLRTGEQHRRRTRQSFQRRWLWRMCRRTGRKRKSGSGKPGDRGRIFYAPPGAALTSVRCRNGRWNLGPFHGRGHRGEIVIRSAILLAAGRGKRQRPYTDTTPKPLLPVRGRPTLDYVLTSVKHANVERVCIVTRHLEE